MFFLLLQKSLHFFGILAHSQSNKFWCNLTMIPKINQPITPKSLNALQRLLLQNTPANHRQPNDNSKQYHSQQSGSQSGSAGYPFHKPVKASRKVDDSSQNFTPEGRDIKKELLKVLSDKRKKKSNFAKLPFNNKVQQKPLSRRAQTNLNQLLKQDTKGDPQSSDRNELYKQKRPPELQDLEESSLSVSHRVQSARVQSKAPTVHREIQTTKAKNSPQHFTFEPPRKPVGPGGGGLGFNMFSSMNEVLRQYIQAKSSQESETVAGTGEGVRLNDPSKVACQSARNASQAEHSRFQVLVIIQSYFCNASQVNSDTKKKFVDNGNQQLEKVYLRTAKMLNNFKAKEAQWRQEKRALKDEVMFLKSLLKQSQCESNN